MNESFRSLWKSEAAGTSSLCIREGETAAVAMTERILEISTIVSDLMTHILAHHMGVMPPLLFSPAGVQGVEHYDFLGRLH
jgi:hypothetical protein